MSRTEAVKQAELFQKYWHEPLEWDFRKLPLTGIIPEERVPYCGHIYPDGWGGTEMAMRKYDRAFYRGTLRATMWERSEIASTKEASGLFGFRRTPHWAGHCNGWTSAAIRHAEPERSVSRRGVVFTPSDIKAMLAELYTYQDVESLAGDGTYINPGMLHVLITNWVGRKKQSLGMDSSVGKEIWNYPIYSYRASAARPRGNSVTVRMNLGYCYLLDQESDKAPQDLRYLAFHYRLYLDNQGRIVGGDYMRGSDRMDMLWFPKEAKQGGTEGNRGGNPYLNKNEVLAIWRSSVSQKTHLAWDAALPKPTPPAQPEAAPQEAIAAAPTQPEQPQSTNVAVADQPPQESTAADDQPSATAVETPEPAEIAPQVAANEGAAATATPQPEQVAAVTPEATQPQAAAPVYSPVPNGFGLGEKPLRLRR